jgi:hypothetical protein
VDKRYTDGLKRLMRDLAHNFCNRYLPDALPLDSKVDVKEPMGGWAKGVDRATIIIRWLEKAKDANLKDKDDRAKYTEFNQETWTRQAKEIVVGGSYGYRPELRPTKRGEAMHKYNELRGDAKTWSWTRACLEKTRDSLQGVREFLDERECGARLNTLAEAFPAALE